MSNDYEQPGESTYGGKIENNILERTHAEALSGESYEDASAALGSIETLQAFRKKLRYVPFGSFHEVIETVTNINRMRLSKEEKGEHIEQLTNLMEEKSNRFSPRVADLYMRMIAEIRGETYECKYKEVETLMSELKKRGIEGQMSDLEVLFSPDQSWQIKLNRIETRLTGTLEGLRTLDEREGREMNDDIRKWREDELKKAPKNPPERRGESKPGVDPMERLKEGEKAPAIWSINPAYGGYYKEQSFSVWDSTRNVWTEDKHVYSVAETVPLCDKGGSGQKLNLTMQSKVFAGKWVTLPAPYTHSLHKVEAGGRDCSARKDQNGDLVIYVEGNGEEVELNVVLAPYSDKKFTSKVEDVRVPDMPSEFSEETDEKLEEIKNKKRGNIAKAEAIASYVMKRVKYLAPKDHNESNRYNSAYNTHPKGFAGAVDEIKEADCDVTNTYFAALCAKLNIPVRHCIGHSVKGKDEHGNSIIHSGTGHGWSEVWDEVNKEWVRKDATPPGDSQLEEQEEQDSSESIPGDYGEQEAIVPTDEEIEELREKLAEQKEKLSYTKEERQLAEHAGIELKEARQIVKEINEAEKTRLPNGELVIDVLSKLFSAIVEARRTTVIAYDGPVRRREGGEAIENIVRHKIGMLSGDTDPVSREKPSEGIKEEKIIGGFDLYIIGDKSGSMGSTVEGEALWKIQRRAEYLIFSSLHHFEKDLKRAGLQKKDMLSVRTQGVSFRGSGEDDIDLDKPLSSEFSPQDKVEMWRSLTKAGGGNGDPEALGYVYEQIKAEIEERGKEDNRLRLVIACSDGGYIGDDSARMQLLAQELHKLNVIVVGMGLTETAKNVPVVMDNPPYSRGDITRDINDLPALVAKHLISEAIKLFPEKAKENAKQFIEKSLNKFKNIK